MEELRKWIKDQYLVKFLVMSSYEATTLLTHMSLTPESLLQPFCEISHSFSVKSLTKNIPCNTFKVQVCEKLDLKRNESVLLSSTPKINWQETFDILPETLHRYLSPEQTPWFHAWKEDFFNSLHFSSHELIDMPLGIIYLASTTDSNPLQTFQTLCRPQGLPSIYQSKIYDSAVPKVFILLHNESKSSMTASQLGAVQDTIQRAQAPHLCYTQTLTSEGMGSLIWEESKDINILQREKLQLQMIMNEVMVRAIVPYVENKLKEHDLVLEQKKRGIKNSFMKMFKNKDKAESFAYQVGCIESACRHLADLAFLFGDYEEAYNHYKSVSNDLKGLKAWAHTGSVHEMMALCSFLLSGDLKEAEYLLDAAYSFYQKAGDQSLLARSLLINRQLFMGPEFAKKLALKLISGSNDVKDIKSAYPLLMEQTALCYLAVSPCYYRKFAFYQVIAGDEFRKLELVQHALNCYYSASHIYKMKKWEHIDMHIQHMLGRFCYFLNLQIESVHFFVKLVAGPKLLQQREQHQRKIMSELLATATQWVGMPVPVDYNPITKSRNIFHIDGKPILEFSLPKITSHSILLPQDKIITDNKPLGTFQPWKSLIKNNQAKLLDSFKHFDGEAVKKWKREMYCGESIEVTVRCFNPLSYPFAVENLEVVLEHESGKVLVTRSLDKLELGALEEKSIVLESQQNFSGKVELKMLKWNVSNIFYGIFNFPSQDFMVAPAVSGLVVQFINFPDRLLEGQVKMLQVKVRNDGPNSVSGIVMTVSHGFLFGKDTVKIADLEAGTENTIELWMRGERIGSHTVRLVVVYQSATELRYCRLQSTLEVRSSLKLSTRFDYSLKEISESVLSLVVRPAMQARLTVKQISSLSNHSLRLIKDIASEVYYIGVQQGPPNQINFDGEWLEQVNTEFCWDLKNMLKQRVDPLALDLILSWELENNEEIVSGHHYLLDLQVPRDKKKNPIHAVVLAPTLVQHDFSKDILCQVSVKISFKNISGEALNTVFVQAVQDEDGQSLVWVGNTSKKVHGMAPGSTEELQLFASFQSPGCYNLNKFSIKVDEVVKDLPKHLHQILIS